MKKPLLLVCFILSTVFGFSQNKEIDSLKQLLKAENHDTIKISLNVEISKKYNSINLDSVKHYIYKAYKLSSLNKNYKQIHIYNGIGLSHYYNSNVDSARYYYDEALKLLDIKNDKILRSIVYSNYALSYEQSNNNEKKIEYNLKAIELVEGNDVEVCLLYYNQGVYFHHSELLDQALKYFKLAYSSSEKANDFRVMSGAIYALSVMYMMDDKLDKAKVYIDKGLDLCEDIKTPEICYFSNNQLGIYYDKLKKYDKANKAFLESKKYAIQYNRKHDIMASNITLGQNEYNRGNYTISSKYFEEFEQLFLEESTPSIGVQAYKEWAKTEAKRKRYKKAYELISIHSTLRDSSSLKENKQVLADAEAKYETEKKDKELVEQQLQLEQQENELRKKKTQYNYMSGIAIFLLIASLLSWFIYQQRQKRKNQEILTLKREHQVKTLESLMEGEEKERFRIAKELHDGVNGDLSAIKYKLTSMIEKNTVVINEVVQMIDKSCKQVRAISHNLIPPSLEKFDLVEAIDGYCTTVNDIHKPEITFQHIGETIDISKKDEVNIFRIIQEMVANSIKHANANEINVQISNRENNLQITVEDNGKGFNTNEVKGDGIGLQNIQSRVDYLNGTMDLVSNSKGTSYTIEIDTEKLHDH